MPATTRHLLRLLAFFAASGMLAGLASADSATIAVASPFSNPGCLASAPAVCGSPASVHNEVNHHAVFLGKRGFASDDSGERLPSFPLFAPAPARMSSFADGVASRPLSFPGKATPAPASEAVAAENDAALTSHLGDSLQLPFGGYFLLLDLQLNPRLFTRPISTAAFGNLTALSATDASNSLGDASGSGRDWTSIHVHLPGSPISPGAGSSDSGTSDGGSATSTPPPAVTPEPEPPSLLMVLAGTVFLLLLEWKRF